MATGTVIQKINSSAKAQVLPQSRCKTAFLAVPCLLIVDIIAIVVSLFLAFELRNNLLPLMLPQLFKHNLLENTIINIWWMPLALIFSLAYEELYYKRLPYWKETEKVIKACTLAMVIIIAILYLAKLAGDFSRIIVILTWVISLVLIPLFRFWGKRVLINSPIWQKPILIMGAGETGKLIAKALAREATMGYKIIGFLDDNKKNSDIVNSLTEEEIPILGSFQETEEIINKTKVKEIVIAAPGIPAAQLVQLTNKLQPLVNNVMLVPDLFGLAINGIEVEYFFEEQALFLNVKNRLKSSFNRAIKRVFDLTLGLTTFILTLPLLIFLVVVIRLDSKGKAVFTQKRVGQNGKYFTCYKFRTMYINGDELIEKYLQENPQARVEWQKYNKLRDYDPRVTKTGQLIRKFSLDELPQIINVLLGDMSLVGPRPYLPREEEQMGEYLYDIQVTKPGITGLWQVSGRNNIDFQGRLKLDTWYVRNWSLWLDIILLIKTVKVVLSKEGAY